MSRRGDSQEIGTKERRRELFPGSLAQGKKRTHYDGDKDEDEEHSRTADKKHPYIAFGRAQATEYCGWSLPSAATW